MGGVMDAHTSISYCEYYTVTENKWRKMAHFPKPRYSGTAINFQKRFIYIIGGSEVEIELFEQKEEIIYRYDTRCINSKEQAPKWESFTVKTNSPQQCQYGVVILFSQI